MTWDPEVHFYDVNVGPLRKISGRIVSEDAGSPIQFSLVCGHIGVVGSHGGLIGQHTTLLDSMPCGICIPNVKSDAISLQTVTLLQLLASGSDKRQVAADYKVSALRIDELAKAWSLADYSGKQMHSRA